jgi:deoxyhypusine monooxygenase
VLEQFVNHHAPEIAETCQIAIDLIQFRLKNADNTSAGIFLSVDPAPPMTESKSIAECRDILLNPSLSLFDRYRAMFTLRDMNSNEAALALVDGFSDSSALFRHEVAYVLGQMQREVTVPGLSIVLNNLTEHEMVRHEAAESLGSIGTPECEAILASYRDDSKQVVKESCIVALDTLDYWTTPSDLQGAVAISE